LRVHVHITGGKHIKKEEAAILMEQEFKSKDGVVSIEVFSAWWYAKRKNVQAIPAEAAQEVKDKYWKGGEWRETIRVAVNGVFGNIGGHRDSRHMNSHDRIAWACDQIGQLKRLMASEQARRGSDAGLVENPLVGVSGSGTRGGQGATKLNAAGVAGARGFADVVQSKQHEGQVARERAEQKRREEEILQGQKQILELLRQSIRMSTPGTRRPDSPHAASASTHMDV
jgi:hypothetical protein